MNDNVVNQNTKNQRVATWLKICAICVLLMVAVGGYTRLTNSGLSMTTWKPVTGIIPPITDDAWQAEMDLYRASPEYQKINEGFTVDEFKNIFYVEWFHRVIGRGIGFIFLIPLVFFYIKKYLTHGQALRLGGVFALGGLQGVVGWYMVSSGLVDDPHVSPYRLALHLMLAMLIFVLLVRASLQYASAKEVPTKITDNISLLLRMVKVFILLIAVQSTLGAFVAGLKAGLIYNTFPMMGEQWLPDELWFIEPWYRDIAENPVTAQFFHRLNACVVLVFGIVMWGVARKKLDSNDAQTRVMFNDIFLALCIQLLLGVLTLLYQVPVSLGVMHQVMAFILVLKSLKLYHQLQFSQGTK